MKNKSSPYEQKIKYFVIGSGVSLLVFLVTGMVTALLPNPWFIRMLESSLLDYLYLISSSLLLGAYTGVHYFKKSLAVGSTRIACAGGVGGFLAFSCPICNKILLLLFGSTALLTYFEPVRPLLGLVSVVILVTTLYWRIKN